MADSQSNIRVLFAAGQNQRKRLESSWEASNTLYQENVRAAIRTFEECRSLADRIQLFSQNETEDDISSGNLQYLMIDYYLAELTLRDTTLSRKFILLHAQDAFERFLTLLDTYSLLSTKGDSSLYETYLDNRTTFTTAASSDAAARRDTKIARFRQETDLKRKLEYLSQNSTALESDDAAIRQLYLAEIQLYVHQTFQALDMIARELQILASAPLITPTGTDVFESDYRQQGRSSTREFSERLDPPISQLLANSKSGPILSKNGKPLKPFTLLDSRQRLRDGVFRPDHSLPTMTIDEYLEEEKRRGGMIDGGGEQSKLQPDLDEDNIEKADIETMKAREWDEYTEANPKGTGNTLNRG
ncbi:TAP42-like protein [Lasallia pustulata]|uniref:TAP42-like protein n=1 Tax=Lasallia pustulata TaxID=136370 RepID=A0A1W5DAP0_9LECA|nr:TAP42-like protein [Lasallia pustulata]